MGIHFSSQLVAILKHSVTPVSGFCMKIQSVPTLLGVCVVEIQGHGAHFATVE